MDQSFTPNRFEYIRDSENPPTPPRKPPAFQPRPTIQRRSSPPLDLANGKLIRPLGNELLIRGILVNGKPSQSPTTTVKKIIEELARRDETLSVIPVEPVPFRSASDEPTTSCYVTLQREFLRDNSSETPRFDLLDIWKAAIKSHCPTWEVVWAPQKRGADKRMWVRFPTLKTRDDLEDVTSSLAKWAKQMGYCVTGSFHNAGGPTLVLGNPQDVDRLVNRMNWNIPAISKDSIKIVKGRQIEIENAFEMVVMGIRDDSELETLLQRWLEHTYTDPVTNEPLLSTYRVPRDNSNAFVFSMANWAATARVLSDLENFKQRFPAQQYNLSPPELLYTVNSTGVFRKTISETFEQGANQITSQLRRIESRIDNVEKSTREGLSAMSAQMRTMEGNLNTLTGTIEMLSARTIEQQTLLLLEQRNSKLQLRLFDMESKRTDALEIMRYGSTQQEKEQAKARVDHAEAEIKRIKAMLEPEDVVIPLITNIGAPPTPPTTANTRTSTADDHDTDHDTTSTKRARVDNQTTADNILTRPSGLTPSAANPNPDIEMLPPTPNTRTRQKTNNNRVSTSQNISSPSPLMRKCEVHPTNVRKRFKKARRNPGACLKDNTQSMVVGKEHARMRKATHTYIKRANASVTRLNCAAYILLLLTFLSIIPISAAIPHAASPLSVYALNTNGLVQPGKIFHVNRAITTRRPHVFILSETKTNTRIAPKLPYPDYNIFEEPGQPASNHHIYKWGVVVGIRKDVQVAQRAKITAAALSGRVVAVDVVIPTSDGGGFPHRIIGTYAPWDPGANDSTRSFWTEVMHICKDASTGWTLAGDLNSTIARFERASGGSDAREHFTRFLHQSDGTDLWSLMPDRTRERDWTCRARASMDSGGSIIDRVVVDQRRLVDAEVQAADRDNDYVPYTDHRAVIATIVLKPPNLSTKIELRFEMAQCPSGKPRIRYPGKAQASRFELFQNRVDQSIQEAKLHEHTVTDDTSFLERYHTLTEIMNDHAERTFGRRRPLGWNLMNVTSVNIRRLTALTRQIGGAIRIAIDPHTHGVSYGARTCYMRYRRLWETSPPPRIDLVSYLRQTRRQICKELFKERIQTITQKTMAYDRYRIRNALDGASTKRLTSAAEYIPLPTVINDIHDENRLITNEEEVKEATRAYWQNLYTHRPTPPTPKPWMDSPSIKAVRERVSREPFEWPKPASLEDFKAMLRRGTPRPSPGPDGWEKWVVKALSDRALALILDLHNYIVMNARFPGDIKDMWLTMFHKRGIRTNLKNWRGLMLSNFIANSPMTWLNHKLIPYASRLQIIPETQVAAQQGVQTRDVISFLASIKCWAHRNKAEVYALQRDQMKGFDYLSPQGFYDAIIAYGLPTSIIDLDREAQSHTRSFPRTAFGITRPITLDGLTKQGGPLSPVKSTFTTSLGNRYLHDIASTNPGALILSSTSASKGDPHLPDDKTHQLVAMVEATDDSYIFARTLTTLQIFCLAMERFQFAYGWLTQWEKSQAYVLNPSDTAPTTVAMPSISADDPNPWTISSHDVPLVKDQLEFLRTKVDEPNARFEQLSDFIESFTIPKLAAKIPITLIRRMMIQSVASRCRALLALQTVTRSQAEQLDNLIKMKIHHLSGFPFPPNTDILCLPIPAKGLGFPSITRINAGLAVNGLVRDINHHIPAYKNVSRITLSDWTCQVNKCTYPLDGNGLTRDFSRAAKNIPAAWITAHQSISSLNPKLSIRRTDCSFILTGDVSLSHVLRAASPHIPGQVNGNTLRLLRGINIRTLQDAGRWNTNRDGVIFVPHQQDTHTRSWTEAKRNGWAAISNTLRQLKIGWLFEGDAELLLPSLTRKTQAENQIRRLAELFKFPPSRLHDDLNRHHAWASDGSMRPADASLTEPKSVTAAITGRETLVVRLTGWNRTIMHGEIMGIIMGYVLNKPDTQSPILYTDHLNSARLLEECRSELDGETRLRWRNGRSLYRWLSDLGRKSRMRTNYTPGHATDQSTQSQLNNEADHYASTAQNYFQEVPPAPEPTFYMDEFTPYRHTDGWIESDIPSFVDEAMTRITANRLSNLADRRMIRGIYDDRPPPAYPYVRATSAFSAVVQLYARSGQLPTAETLWKRNKIPSPTCRFGCPVIEDMHHIFVRCPKFEDLREKATEVIVKRTEEACRSNGSGEALTGSLLETAKFLFHDDSRVWPLGSSAYFLGHNPPLAMPREDNTPNVTTRQTLHRITKAWHHAGVLLAGRIWGTVQREMAKEFDWNRKWRKEVTR